MFFSTDLGLFQREASLLRGLELHLSVDVNIHDENRVIDIAYLVNRGCKFTLKSMTSLVLDN